MGKRAARLWVSAALALVVIASSAQSVHAQEPGQLDTTFAGDGVKRLDFGRTDYALSAFVDDRGALTIGGAASLPLPDRVAAARLRPNGRIDTTFGDDGKTTIRPGADGTYVAAWASDSFGRLLVLGGRETSQFANNAFYLMRLTRNGRLDMRFGDDGLVNGRLGSGFNEMQDVLALPTGRILILGSVDGSSIVKAYSAHGAHDRAFGTNGEIRIAGLRAAALLYQPSGRILIVGARTQRRLTVDGLTPSGQTDEAFGVNGRATVSISGSTGSVFVPPGAAALSANGEIVVGAELESNFELDTIVATFKPDGRVNRAFGDGKGWRRFNLGAADGPNAIVPLQDGRLVVVGDIANDLFGDDPSSDLFLLGLKADGRRWRSFGSDGLVRTDFGNADDAVFAFDARLVSGRLVVVGGSRDNMLVARFFLSTN